MEPSTTMMMKTTRNSSETYLVKGTNIDATAKADMLGMKAENVLLFKPFLSKPIIGSESSRKYWRYDEGQNV